MKTIEEKAKAYDSIIEKANKMHSENCEACKACIEELIPELAESEDEKIRKELIDAVQGLWDNDALPMPLSVKRKDKWLAWIEKQGEHANFLSKIQVGDKVTRNEAGVLVNLSQLNRVAKKNEKQGEQKPADSYCQENCKGFQETGKCFADGGCKAKREAEQKTKENKGNLGGISPNWSDDDERMLDYVIGDILSADTLIGGKETASYKCDWLKSLKGRVQHQQEWSKEDEACVILLDSICESSEAEYYDHPDSIIRKEIVNARNWLKSLRPQSRWKPSSEQIGLLQAIINEPNNASSESCQIVLKDILEQLKKLKKEQA